MELRMIKSMCWMKRVLTGGVCQRLIASIGYGTTVVLMFALLLTAGCAQQPIADEAPYFAERLSKPLAKPSNVQRPKVDFSQLVPEHFIVQSEQHGDLDADGDEDVLLVLQDTRGDEARFRSRALQIFLRADDGNLEETVMNPHAILCSSCGGMLGEPLQGIEIAAGKFSLRFEGGSREVWSREYRFVYVSQARTWLLNEFESVAHDRITEESGSSRLTPKDFGAITIERFDPLELSGYSFP